MASLTCRTGASVRLLKKRDEPLLWMEVYTDIADADTFERALQNIADEFDIDIFIDGIRQTECFHCD